MPLESDTVVSYATVLGRLYDAGLEAGALDAMADQLSLTVSAEADRLSLEQRFDWACRRLALDPLERAVLALCAAPELSAECGRLVADLHGDAGARQVTPRLVGRLLAAEGVSVADVLVCFDRAARLARCGALRLAGSGAVADRPVTVGPALVGALLGSRLLEDRCERVDPSLLPLGRPAQMGRLAALMTHPPAQPLVVVGADAALALATATGRGVVTLHARDLSDPDACADLALVAALEARAPAISGFGALGIEDARAALQRGRQLACRPALILTERGETTLVADLTAHLVELPLPSPADRAAAWAAASDATAAEARALAERYQLSISAITEAAEYAGAEAQAAGEDRTSTERLWSGARAASSRRLAELAELLPPGPRWEDLVLPARQTTALHAMSSFLAHRQGVLEDWGYKRIAGDRGLTALFAGESGTGKTLAARVIAGASELEVYRVDLSALFSKWVGETEKNLDRIFTAGQSANVVLFFDEADVVFGRRTESSDASARYANLETAFLLQRIESYEGVVVLATNLRSNMDDAFLRRLDLVIDFPPPDASTRRRLWMALLPDAAPRASDIDLDFLADRFELTGGGIRNCSLAAALLAAEDGATISMRHLIRAVALEFAKLGRLTVEADFGSFHGVASGR